MCCNSTHTPPPVHALLEGIFQSLTLWYSSCTETATDSLVRSWQDHWSQQKPISRAVSWNKRAVMASSRTSCLTAAPSPWRRGENTLSGSQATSWTTTPERRWWVLSKGSSPLEQSPGRGEKWGHAQGSCQGTSGPCIESLVCPSTGSKKSSWGKGMCKWNVGRALRGARDQKVGGTFKLTENCKCYKEESD